MRAQSSAAFEAFDPEYVLEYEIGLKNQFLLDAGSLRTSAAVYFQDSTDVQRQAPTGIDTNGDGVADTVVTLIRNISAQETIGGELEANFAFDNGFSVGAWYSYVKVDVTEGLQAGEAEMRGIPENQAGLNLTYRRELTGEGTATPAQISRIRATSTWTISTANSRTRTPTRLPNSVSAWTGSTAPDLAPRFSSIMPSTNSIVLGC